MCSTRHTAAEPNPQIWFGERTLKQAFLPALRMLASYAAARGTVRSKNAEASQRKDTAQVRRPPHLDTACQRNLTASAFPLTSGVRLDPTARLRVSKVLFTCCFVHLPTELRGRSCFKKHASVANRPRDVIPLWTTILLRRPHSPKAFRPSPPQRRR